MDIFSIGNLNLKINLDILSYSKAAMMQLKEPPGLSKRYLYFLRIKMAGLGLWFVYSLVARWGGMVEAESEKHRDTCVNIYLRTGS